MWIIEGARERFRRSGAASLTLAESAYRQTRSNGAQFTRSSSRIPSQTGLCSAELGLVSYPILDRFNALAGPSEPPRTARLKHTRKLFRAVSRLWNAICKWTKSHLTMG